MRRREEIAPGIQAADIVAIVQDIEEAVNGVEDVHRHETIDAEVDPLNADATTIDQENWLTIKIQAILSAGFFFNHAKENPLLFKQRIPIVS